MTKYAFLDRMMDIEMSKRAGLIAGLARGANLAANAKILRDMSNEELSGKIDEAEGMAQHAAQAPDQSDKKKKGRKIAVLFSGDSGRKLTDSQKAEIIRIANSISRKRSEEE